MGEGGIGEGEEESVLHTDLHTHKSSHFQTFTLHP